MNMKWKKVFLAIFLFLVFLSVFLSIGLANECGLKDGLTIKYLHDFSIYPGETETELTFTETTDNIYKVDWYWGGNYDITGSWLENTDTRIVSSMQNFGPENGAYTWSWIHTDVAVGDNITMFNYLRFDAEAELHTNYTVTGESTHEKMGVWILEDQYGGVAQYEKTYGFLVNYSATYLSEWETFKFVETNAFDKIPGFNIPILIALIGITSLVMFRKFHKK